MLTVSTSDLNNRIGQPLGESQPHTITQEQVNEFADATGDHQWIHVDVERARRELPYGTTIAHGLLILSMLPLHSDRPDRQRAFIANALRLYAKLEADPF